MKILNIKESRKILKLTQEQLGKKMGVSRKTVNNWENGSEIPETKRELLLSILSNIELENELKEPDLQYSEAPGYQLKIKSLEEEIQTRKNIITESTDQCLITHQNKMIELLLLQIQEIKKAEKNHLQE
jgi:transcriptional regulator with XRE-family HTH domain